MKVTKCLWILSILIFELPKMSSGYYHNDNDYDRGNYGNEIQKCPLQCRCIALSHLGLRGMARTWQSLGYPHRRGNSAWRSVWRGNGDNLQGRDMVCIGLDKVPSPFPHGKFIISANLFLLYCCLTAKVNS